MPKVDREKPTLKYGYKIQKRLIHTLILTRACDTGGQSGLFFLKHRFVLLAPDRRKHHEHDQT